MLRAQAKGHMNAHSWELSQTRGLFLVSYVRPRDQALAVHGWPEGHNAWDCWSAGMNARPTISVPTGKGNVGKCRHTVTSRPSKIRLVIKGPKEETNCPKSEQKEVRVISDRFFHFSCLWTLTNAWFPKTCAVHMSKRWPHLDCQEISLVEMHSDLQVCPLKVL